MKIGSPKEAANFLEKCVIFYINCVVGVLKENGKGQLIIHKHGSYYSNSKYWVWRYYFLNVLRWVGGTWKKKREKT